MGQHQKTLVKVRHFREDSQIFLEYWGIPLWYLLLSQENDGVHSSR